MTNLYLPNIFDMRTKILNEKLWNEIEENLGEVSDFEIIQTEEGIEIHYQSNGIPKVIYSTDKEMRDFIHSFIYCANAFSHKPILCEPVF